MRYASDDLRKEHDGILFGLQLMEEMVYRLNNHQAVELEDVKEMVGFFRLFADKCHHGKEEGLYFPSLERAGIRNQGGPIGQMLLEHTEGRKNIAQMLEILDHEFSAIHFTEAAEAYIQLLRSHIEKENTILFVMETSECLKPSKSIYCKLLRISRTRSWAPARIKSCTKCWIDLNKNI